LAHWQTFVQRTPFSWTGLCHLARYSSVVHLRKSGWATTKNKIPNFWLTKTERTLGVSKTRMDGTCFLHTISKTGTDSSASYIFICMSMCFHTHTCVNIYTMCMYACKYIQKHWCQRGAHGKWTNWMGCTAACHVRLGWRSKCKCALVWRSAIPPATSCLGRESPPANRYPPEPIWNFKNYLLFLVFFNLNKNKKRNIFDLWVIFHDTQIDLLVFVATCSSRFGVLMHTVSSAFLVLSKFVKRDRAILAIPLQASLLKIPAHIYLRATT